MEKEKRKMKKEKRKNGSPRVVSDPQIKYA